ncbi:hypothetical protein MLD38_012676 [Melastoma candidum]|uniref:Uncharacterized protein n=1 Tax=Melastoma candidum TaxID=119954 RepID=A0ACB9R735_9MYRT|nr:hypothetical protein MLD38_012676 [Melastoma candidum]
MLILEVLVIFERFGGEILGTDERNGNFDLAAKSFEKVCPLYAGEDQNLFLTKEGQAFQSEVVRLAHSEMKHPVPLDVSPLITFSGNPMELCGKDPGTLPIIFWSSFPDEITLDHPSLTLMATKNADERAKALKSSSAIVLKLGQNTIALALPPQKPGSYVLGSPDKIGQLRFRSHGSSKDGPADTDDVMSSEKPTRPILKVFESKTAG